MERNGVNIIVKEDDSVDRQLKKTAKMLHKKYTKKRKINEKILRKKSPIEKVFSGIFDTLCIVLIILSVYMCYANISARLQNTNPSIMGYTNMRIASGSMVNSGHEVGDIIMVRAVDTDTLKIGDKIAFYVSAVNTAKFLTSSHTEVDDSTIGETVYKTDIKTILGIPSEEIKKVSKNSKQVFHHIIGIYESQLKIPIKERAFLISRQAMRAEIEYHNRCIQDIQNNGVEDKPNKEQSTIIQETPKEDEKTKQKPSLVEKLDIAKKLMQDKKYTDAIEAFNNILETENIDLLSVVESPLYLARLYKLIENNNMASHYYDLVETYYKQHKELINLNYLYYETADLYFKMYKHDRAIETIKKVIYSVDTPQSLMVQACTLLGNIYSEINNYNDAYSYYQKALESLDEHTENEVLAELCFKFALANDDKEDFPKAFEYYNKCIVIEGNHPFKAMSYSNLASCYLESENYSDALDCFQRAYDIEKTNNNYEGIYYNSSHIAQILIMQNSKTALNYLLEAKKSAEFINEDFYILESTIALGDYYYNIKQNSNEALIEYFKARKIAERLSRDVDISKIEQRIQDMKLRMSEQEFTSLENKYAR